jgi:hypothetical protein
MCHFGFILLRRRTTFQFLTSSLHSLRAPSPPVVKCSQIPVSSPSRDILASFSPSLYGLIEQNLTHDQRLRPQRNEPIPDPVLPYDVPFEGHTFKKVSLLKCVDYNIQDPHQFPEIQVEKYTEVIQ